MPLNRFHEEQPMRQWWLMLLIGGIAALQWWGFIQQILLGKPWGNNPTSDSMMVLLWLLIGIGLPIFFLDICRLVVTVTDAAVCIRYRPFMKRTIPHADIAKAEARTYSPLREYGGWGLRGWGKRWAYTVSGNRGVELTLEDGSIIMIGSQRADELAHAIPSAQRRTG